MQDNVSENDLRAQQQDKWTRELRAHKQEMHKDIDRWAYICGDKVHGSMCNALMEYCKWAGLEVVKHKLDWTEFHRLIANIGKERCDAEGCDNIALIGFSTCIICKRKIERKIENQKRKARELEISKL